MEVCTSDSIYVYTVGCTTEVIEYVTDSFEVIGIVCLSLAALEVRISNKVIYFYGL